MQYCSDAATCTVSLLLLVPCRCNTRWQTYLLDTVFFLAGASTPPIVIPMFVWMTTRTALAGPGQVNAPRIPSL